MQKLLPSRLIERENPKLAQFSIYTLRLKIISLIQLIQMIKKANLQLSFGRKAQIKVTWILKKKKIKIKKKKMKTKKRKIIINWIKKKESLKYKKQSI